MSSFSHLILFFILTHNYPEVIVCELCVMNYLDLIYITAIGLEIHIYNFLSKSLSAVQAMCGKIQKEG